MGWLNRQNGASQYPWPPHPCSGTVSVPRLAPRPVVASQIWCHLRELERGWGPVGAAPAWCKDKAAPNPAPQHEGDETKPCHCTSCPEVSRGAAGGMRKPQPREGREGKETQRRQRGGAGEGGGGLAAPRAARPAPTAAAQPRSAAPAPGGGLRQHWGAELPWVLSPRRGGAAGDGLPWGGAAVAALAGARIAAAAQRGGAVGVPPGGRGAPGGREKRLCLRPSG